MILLGEKHFVQIVMSWIFHQKKKEAWAKVLRYRTFHKNSDLMLSLLQCINHPGPIVTSTALKVVFRGHRGLNISDLVGKR